MSKNLRVFFLSVLVVVLAVSSAFAATLQTITIGKSDTTYKGTYYTYDNGQLVISQDGIYKFDNSWGKVSIDVLSFDKVSDVTLVLPAPNPDQPGQGTEGKWQITLPNSDDEGHNISKTYPATIKIEKAGTNSAFIFRGANFSLDVKEGINLIIDAPFRVNADHQSFDVSFDVRNGATLTLGSWAEVFTNSGDIKQPTGYLPGSTGLYTVSGEIIIQNQYAIRGSALGVDVRDGGKITFDIPNTPTIDLRGVGETSSGKVGATLSLDGTINVPQSLVLVGEIHMHDDSADKQGSGTLTLSQVSGWPTQALSWDVKELVVTTGTLVLNGKPSWGASTDAKVTVKSGATFTANEGSILEDGDSIKFSVAGTANFKKHAIIRGKDEIYPYDKYITKNNGIKIDTTGISIDVASSGTVNLDDGSFALETLFGNGTINITNNNEVQDRTVLIFTSPDNKAGYTKFTGKIQGTHANVGLYTADRNHASFDSLILGKATVSIDNLIVYGPAILTISDETNLSNVKNIYLRGHRPGANNFTDAAGTVTNDAVANANLTVGSLLFMDETTQEISGIKIDGTGNEDDMAQFILGKSADVKVSNIEFYANLGIVDGISRDFPVKYVVPEDGIYALTIDGSNQPSRITIDGTTITGNGLAADVANTEKVYQVQITDSSDVKFTGNNGASYYPLAPNNSLYVGKNAKLEMSRGAVIDGHLTFGGSTTSVSTIVLSNDDYPKDWWFASGDNKWNLEKLNGYSTFTTQVGANNRRTNEGGEYAVQVTGDLTLSFDQAKVDANEAYPGNILIRTKTDIDAFAGFLEDSTRFTTIGERFKVLGTTGTASKYTKDFTTVWDDMFQFRIPADSADLKGVTVEVRTELAILELGEWSFIRGGEEFGQGAGHNFAIKIPLKAIIRGEEATISRESVDNEPHYYLGVGTNKYYITDPAIYFRKYEDGSQLVIDNVIDTFDKWTADTLVRDDITLRAEFELYDDSGNLDPFIRLIGTSYTGEKPVDVSLAVLLSGDKNLTAFTTLNWLNGVIPAFRTFTLKREGAADDDTGLQFSTADAAIEGQSSFRTDEDANAAFTVSNFRKATYNTTATPVFNGSTYVWNVTVDNGTYYMLNSNGKETRVTDMTVKLFDGYYLNRTTVSSDITDSFDLTVDGNIAHVSVPLELLGGTGSRLFAEKGLALVGTTDAGGKIMTVPVTYALRSAVSADNTITADTLNQTVTVGDKANDGVFDIDPSVLSGDIHFDYHWADWITFTGGGETIAYTIPDTSKAVPGVYNFSILAYTGDNDAASAHKLYTFTVTVLAPVVPHIEPEEDVTVNVLVGETNTAELTFVSGDSTVATWAIADNTNPAGLLTDSASGNTYTLSINAAGIVAGTYEYTVNANANGEVYTHKVTVVVSEPTFEIEEVYNGFTYFSPVDGHTYYAVYSASGAAGTVEWALTDNTRSSLRSYHSGDQFVVEGIAKLAQDSDEMDIDQTFRVVATSGNRTVDEPIETTFTVEAEDEDIAASAKALTPAAGSHDAVDSTYVVNFPAGVTADVDSVHLPSWLEPVMGNTEDTADYVVGVKFSKVAGELPNGTEGTVFVEAYDDEAGENVYYKWNVKYNAEPAKLELTLTPATLTVAVSADGTSKASVTNALGNVTYTLSKDAALTWVTVSGDVVTVSKPTTSGTYTVTVIAQDDRGVVGQATAVLTINVSPDVPGDFTITPSRTTVTFTSPTDAAQTVTLSANLLGATVTYSATVSPATGLSADVSGSTLTLTPSAVGSYTVTVTGTNGERTATATINVTVGTTPAPTFTITPSRTTVTFTSPTDAAQTVTLSANLLGATVTYTAAVSPATGLTASISGSTLTLTPSAAGSYVVTVTGTNGTRTATATINVTVGTAPVTTFTITADPSTLTFVSPAAPDQEVTLSSNFLGATVTYTAAVTTGSEDGLALDVDENVLTVDALAAGSYTITVTGTNGERTATATINVTVGTPARVGSSGGGGCDAGFGALALVLAAPLFLRRRRS